MEGGKTRKGRIIRVAGGFYDVQINTGDIIRCTVRGRHKNNEETVITGDFVEVLIFEDYRGIIEKIIPRANFLERPLIANVSQILAVVSARKPHPEWNTLGRQLVSAETQNIKPIICLNKTDLIDKHELQELKDNLKNYPYKTIYTSVIKKEGMDKIEKELMNHTTVLTGPSGVGKTSIINILLPELKLKTSAVSVKIERGRHTTRHVELINLKNGGIIADTPGFSRIDVPGDFVNTLDEFYPEIKSYKQECRFRNCLHKNEPGCAVKNAVATGSLSIMRYEHYLEILEEHEIEKERI